MQDQYKEATSELEKQKQFLTEAEEDRENKIEKLTQKLENLELRVEREAKDYDRLMTSSNKKLADLKKTEQEIENLIDLRGKLRDIVEDLKLELEVRQKDHQEIKKTLEKFQGPIHGK